MTDSVPLLELRGATKRYGADAGLLARLASHAGMIARTRTLAAVDNVSLSIAPGEVLGLVGESASGKSTLGRMAAGLLPMSGGSRWWKGRQLDASTAQREPRTALAMQMIFQDAHAALNPRMRVGQAIVEAPLAHGLMAPAQQDDAGAALLRMVGLDPSLRDHYPHQLSGGQRARIGIARALAVQPEFLVCDEAIAALDVSIQAQVINLFMRLRDELRLTYLFISHDLGAVRHVSDRIAIMYMGQIVELASCADVFARPAHPYTRTLLAATPRFEVGRVAFLPIRGEMATTLEAPSGCYFHPRCPQATARCKAEAPRMRELAPLHFAACHLDPGAS